MDVEVGSKREALELIYGISLDYDGYREADDLMDIIDEIRDIAYEALGDEKERDENKEKRTIEEWSEIKGIDIIDPDGFRTQKLRGKDKYTEEEFDEAAMYSTLKIDSNNVIPSDYKKKPVKIEAVKWSGLNYEDVDYFMQGNGLIYNNGRIEIDTLEGTMRANLGDYIIKGINGEFYPCKPEIFKKTYEKVEECSGI